MSPAKPVEVRIREPRKEDGQKKRGAKARDFSVGRSARASEGRARGDLPFRAAAYALSVHDPRALPPPGRPEIAFVGRSNAGKSSAINALTGRKRLAFVSKTPGRTQLINFFALEDAAFLVDLPGYGYAGVPAAVRAHWESLVGSYVLERPSLAAVVVIMDARHPFTPLDEHLMEWLRRGGRQAHILLTKSDKLSRQAAHVTLAQARARAAILCPGASVQLFSSLKREGIDEAARRLSVLAAQKNKSPG